MLTLQVRLYILVTYIFFKISFLLLYTFFTFITLEYAYSKYYASLHER